MFLVYERIILRLVPYTVSNGTRLFNMGSKGGARRKLGGLPAMLKCFCEVLMLKLDNYFCLFLGWVKEWAGKYLVGQVPTPSAVTAVGSVSWVFLEFSLNWKTNVRKFRLDLSGLLSGHNNHKWCSILLSVVCIMTNTM